MATSCVDHKFCAMSMAILVANDAVKVLIKLFQSKIVMSNLSVFDFRFFNSFAQNFFCFTKVLILWDGTDIKAVSDEEKNADNKNNKTKIVIDKGSIYINKKMIKTPFIIDIYFVFSRLKHFWKIIIQKEIKIWFIMIICCTKKWFD